MYESFLRDDHGSAVCLCVAPIGSNSRLRARWSERRAVPAPESLLRCVLTRIDPVFLLTCAVMIFHARIMLVEASVETTQ